MYARVVVAELSKHAEGEGATRRKRVHLHGLCVHRERVERECLERFVLDDGTGVALVQLRDPQGLQGPVAVGQAVTCYGEVCHSSVRTIAAGTWTQWVQTVHVHVVEDPNAESLRMIECVHLHETVYSQPMQAHASSRASSAFSLPLLEFPTSAKELGRKRPVETLQSRPQTAPSPQRLLEMRNGGAGGPAQDKVPPAEYQFRVASADAKLLESGVKTLEIRLNNPPYSVIRADDRLKFNGRVMSTVLAVRKYANLRSALEMEDIQRLLPTTTNTTITTEAAIRHLRQFFGEAEEAKHGVAVFEVQVRTLNVQKSADDWSKEVYQKLAAVGSSGCTLRDLQFAFPALPVAQLEGILAELQMDAVVYKVRETFHLL